MRIRLFRGAAMAVTVVLALATSPTSSRACTNCSPYAGCETVAVGFLTCWAASIGGIPTCMVAGGCPGGGGNADDFFPKRRSPLIESASTPPGVEELRLYWLILPVDEAMPSRLGRSVLLTDARVDPARPRTFVLATAGAAGVAPVRLRVANAESLVGPPALAASFIAADGGGYTIEATATAAGAHVGLCRIEASAVHDRLAGENLEPGDVLVVPMRLAGEPCLMALALAPAFGMDRPGRDRERRMRESFHAAGLSLSGESGHPGYAMEMLSRPLACR